MKRTLIKIVVALAVVWVMGCVAIYAAMRQPPETFGRVMARMPGPVVFLAFPFETLWTHARAGNLRVGDAAPDFSLSKLDKTGHVDKTQGDETKLQLAALNRQQPTVLVFGSYT
jgi:hypothetical protein